LALRPRPHRFTHAGSAEAALEAIEKVSEHNLGLLPRIYLLHHPANEQICANFPFDRVIKEYHAFLTEIFIFFIF